MVLWAGDDGEPRRPWTPRNNLMDIVRMVGYQIIPQQNSIVVSYRDRSRLDISANVIAEVCEDVDRRPLGSDNSDPTPRVLNAPAIPSRDAWVPWLDGEQDCELVAVMVVTTSSNSENLQCPPTSAIALF